MIAVSSEMAAESNEQNVIHILYDEESKILIPHFEIDLRATRDKFSTRC